MDEQYFIDVYLIDGTCHTIDKMMTLEAIRQFMSEAGVGLFAFSSTTGEINIVPMTSVLRVALRRPDATLTDDPAERDHQ